MNDSRPTPEAILSRIKQEESDNGGRGKLKIFFGAVAGVGKTYSMLSAARKLKEENTDVLVGYIETHGRKETEALLAGLEILPPRNIDYRGTTLREFDLDAALKRKPAVILVDELAHSNAPGSRHNKRWQDVQELLEAGIDVYSTLNVQHVESLHDVISQITKISIRERVPDSILENAHDIELVDLPPDELLERLADGKVYVPEQAHSAMQNFFRKGNLIALRELVLRYLAERVVADMEAYRQVHEIKHPWPASERILVCISPSPLSARLVRAGKRMAEALRAKWTVLFVERQSQVPISLADKDRVIQTLRLAEQLGAETLELSSTNVAEEIIKCAGQYNCTKIVIGKPARPRWKEILYHSVVDDVIRRSGAIDVYVITGDEGSSLPTPARAVKASSPPDAYIKTLAVVILFSVLSKAILPYFELSNLVMMYLLGVVFVASRYGKGPSILASILSVATFDFFCVPPYLTFAVSDTQYLITFAVMLIVALVISTLTVRIKQQAESARLREIRTSALYSMSRDLSSTLGIENICKISLKHIGNVFQCRTAVYLVNSQAQLEFAYSAEAPHDLAQTGAGVAAWVHQNKQAAGLGTNTLPGTSELYLPLAGAQKNLGVLAIKPKQSESLFSPEQFRLLETFANQMAVACERTLLAAESEQARLQVKTEQLRSSLLSSVSHDLRTPLATITGAASSILEGSSGLELETCKQLVKEIYSESIRLNRLVGNLLDITKLQSGSMSLKKELLPVEEVVGAAASYMEDKLEGRHLVTKIPDDLPFVNIDPILFQQVLVNLIENAIKYSMPDTEIEISASLNPGGEQVVLAVADRGPGVRAESKARIFEKFFREEPEERAGVGLGLAICSGIVEAHDGKIWVEDRQGGGSVFKFSMPSQDLLSTEMMKNTFSEDTADNGRS